MEISPLDDWRDRLPWRMVLGETGGDSGRKSRAPLPLVNGEAVADKLYIVLFRSPLTVWGADFLGGG
jgi:hypothetical protein